MRLPFGSTKQRNTWPQQLDGGKHRITSHPLGARNFATVARCLGNQIIDVGVKGKKHIIEVRYDSDDEVCEDGAIDAYLGQSDDYSNSCTEASDSCALEEDSDPCALERQLDGRDDSTDASANISHTINDPAPQQRGDTSEDSHMLAPRSDELPVRVMTHLSSFQAPTTATSHEDISGMSNMMEETCVRDAQHGHVDPQIQEEIQDV
jgi:hypothetical protein